MIAADVSASVEPLSIGDLAVQYPILAQLLSDEIMARFPYMAQTRPDCLETTYGKLLRKGNARDALCVNCPHEDRPTQITTSESDSQPSKLKNQWSPSVVLPRMLPTMVDRLGRLE